MTYRDEPCAVLIDGGLGGLAAAWAASACQSGGAGQPVLVICVPGGGRFRSRQRVAERLVNVCGVKKAVQLHLPETCAELLVNEPPTDPDVRRALSHLLLDACIQAMKLDIQRIVWPVHSGAASESDLRTEAIADACDRSLLVSQLASLDAPRTGPGSRGVRIETPYADLTDGQLAELAIDLGVPLNSCSWCESDDGSAGAPCGNACTACRRWAAALKRAGARVPVGY